jgi:hypothetical protein
MTATVEDPICDFLLAQDFTGRPWAWRPHTDPITALRRPIFHRRAPASNWVVRH